MKTMPTNTILLCDCVDGMRRLPDDCIDLTVTSPPYDELRTCFRPLPMPKFKQVAQQLLRVTKPGGGVAWVVQEQIKDGSQTGTSSEQRLFFRDLGFKLWDRIVMDRHGRRTPAGRRYGLPLEEAFILTKGKPKYVKLWDDKPNVCPGRVHVFRNRRPNGELRSVEDTVIDHRFGVRLNYWRYAVGRHIAEESWVRAVRHGALMPEKLAEDLILSYSKPDALVFDPFYGLATTCKMALLNHRRYLGMEIGQDFHRLAVRRMKEAHQAYERRLEAWLLGA
jgi:site-specific DNA-methyltransferase (adenine-specific)